MRMTLLKMTQLILSAMDSDEINSINDTTEATQVVDIIETTYWDVAATLDFPDHWDFFELESLGDITRPTLMRLPQNVAKVEWIKYDMAGDGETKREIRDVLPMTREKFFDRMNALDTTQPDIYQYNLMVGTGTFDVRGYNNKWPVYYTTNNDRTIIFDNYQADINQTLVGNRTHCYGMLIPEFERSDDFVPEFEPRQFSLFFNEAKSQCFNDLKQVTNTKAEQRARRGWVQAHRKNPQVKEGQIRPWPYPNFGRNSYR